ncbi:MAG: YdaU family protein [Telluria sp.]
MNYYPHHIGDFNSATRFSSRLERSVYRDMLDLYYEKERPLPLDMAVLCRKIVATTPDEIAAVEQVLRDFFTSTEEGWVNNRCQEEIREYHSGNAKSKAGGHAKAAKAAEKRLREEAAATARNVRAGCEQAASSVQAGCEQAAKGLREACAQPASSVRAECEQDADMLRACANQNHNHNHNQNQTNPVAQPTLSEDCARAATPVDLSIALRKEGVNCQPADPRLIQLSGQGVAIETATAACREAKKSKPGQQVIALGYVVKILERWAAEAGALSVSGAAPPARSPPGGHTASKDRARRETIEGLTGQRSNEQQPKFIDINPVA